MTFSYINWSNLYPFLRGNGGPQGHEIHSFGKPPQDLCIYEQYLVPPHLGLEKKIFEILVNFTTFGPWGVSHGQLGDFINELSNTNNPKQVWIISNGIKVQ